MRWKNIQGWKNKLGKNKENGKNKLEVENFGGFFWNLNIEAEIQHQNDVKIRGAIQHQLGVEFNANNGVEKNEESVSDSASK